MAVAVGLGGCVETTFAVPRTPNPVLLGPVDRIGGALAPRAEPVVGRVDGAAYFFASRSQSTSVTGNVTTVTVRKERYEAWAGAFVAAVIEQTAANPTRSVRLSRIHASGYFVSMGAAYIAESREVEVAGVVVDAAPTDPNLHPPLASPSSAIQSLALRTAHALRVAH